MDLSHLSKKPTKNEQETAEVIKAFVADMTAVEDKHRIRLIAVLDIKSSGIVPSFRFVEKENA